MKIVCWNMNSRVSEAAWDEVFALEPDIALLSEVGCVPTMPPGYTPIFEHATGRTRVPRRFQTGMLVRGEIGNEVLIHSRIGWVNDAFRAYPGNFVSRRVWIQGTPLNVISCHMPHWYVPWKEFTDGDVSDVLLPDYSKMSMSDLLRSALPTMMEDDGGAPWIIGGDFNTSEFMGRTKRQRVANVNTIKGMEDLGLKEIVRMANNGPVPTWFHWTGREHQLDHLYVSNVLADSLEYARVGNRETYLRHSDHLPLLAEVSKQAGRVG